MQFERGIDIAAPPAKVWATLVDVESWPLWSESVDKVERLDKSQPFGLNSEARIQQPKMPALTWHVVEFSPGVSFAWTSTTRGVTTWASHAIESLAGGRSRVTLGIRQTGPFAWLASLVVGKQSRRYVDMEAEGLKKFCER
ncbi:MAG: SRPBCC family protein [Chloroflexota bacterium]